MTRNPTCHQNEAQKQRGSQNETERPWASPRNNLNIFTGALYQFSTVRKTSDWRRPLIGFSEQNYWLRFWAQA